MSLCNKDVLIVRVLITNTIMNVTITITADYDNHGDDDTLVLDVYQLPPITIHYNSRGIINEQKHLGCKKSARPISIANRQVRPKALISACARCLPAAS